ncbi:MAG TPA: hypothetical protein VJ323_22570 [Bryobacteraceae bacterium]|nr:hypothetical protein [Bryobacteraceae bacterium]
MIKDTKEMVVAVVGIIAIVGFATAIVITGKSLQEFSNFVVLIVPAMLAGVYASNKRANDKNNDIHSDVGEIKKRVNGELDAKFTAIHQRLSAMGAPETLPFDEETGNGAH